MRSLEGIRIGVLMGGTSAEREVSLKSGAAVSRALRSLKLDVVDIDAGESLCEYLKRERVGLAFIALHGGRGEDGSVQGMLQVMGIPYTGSGVMASAIAMDKLASKRMFAACGLSVPPYVVAESADVEIGMEFPLVVKPSREGSSIGVAIVRDSAALRAALKDALKYEGPALVEKYVRGKEVQIGVLGGRALGGVEVRPGDEFYSYKAKYTAGMTQYILPPELDQRTYQRAMSAGLDAHNALGCSGASRVDLIVEDDGSMHVLEVNTIPGMTETSLLPKIAALSGMDFTELVRAMAIDGLARSGGQV